jgi:hypothetical protein
LRWSRVSHAVLWECGESSHRFYFAISKRNTCAVILSEAQRSRRTPLQNAKLTPRDPSTSLGMTGVTAARS